MGRSHSFQFAVSDPPLADQEGQRVSIVTSDSQLCESLRVMCVNEGYQARQTPPDTIFRQAGLAGDLVLLVIEEPEWALELLGELRANEAYAHVTVMALAPSDAQPEEAAACLLAGADDYCSLSPRSYPELRARLRVHMRNKRYREAIVRLRLERNDLRDRVATDSLTGALARSTLVQFMDRQLSDGAAFAVLFADLDHFKQVNDMYGHQMGDWVLQRVAKTLAQGRRTGDACGRFGGEEFVLVLPNVQPEQALRVAERHRAAVSRLRFQDDGGPKRVTISIGLALFQEDDPDPDVESILGRADTALYKAKNGGRNCVVMAEDYEASAANVATRAPDSLAVGT